ncbi:MAG: hypothetical protein AAF824_11665 [Bacteroidota bacterium]
MFNFFKRKENSNGTHDPIQMVDLNGQTLAIGDIVESLRYNMGRCRIIDSDEGPMYESLESGETVHFLRMVDAATSFQKVRKISSQP